MRELVPRRASSSRSCLFSSTTRSNCSRISPITVHSASFCARASPSVRGRSGRSEGDTGERENVSGAERSRYGDRALSASVYAVNVYGLLLFCKHLASRRPEYDCLRVSGLVVDAVLVGHRTLMGYSRVGFRTVTRARRLSVHEEFADTGSTCSPSSAVLCNRGGLVLLANYPAASSQVAEAAARPGS